MEIKRTNIEVEIEFIEDIYGALPGDEEIYSKFVASKAPDAPGKDERIAKEIEAIGMNETLEKGMTGFARNRDGDPILMSHTIKGFFKSAANAINLSVKKTAPEYLTAYKSKIDKLIMVSATGDLDDTDPGLILEVPEDKAEQALDIKERPLRASTPQGDRTALAASHIISTFFRTPEPSGM